MNISCICRSHFCIFMHIAPIVEEATHSEPIVQEPGEEQAVLQQPPEDPQYPEPQQGYDYVPEAVYELTTDPSEQGRHPMHLKPTRMRLNLKYDLCIRLRSWLKTHLHILFPHIYVPFGTYIS